jgi:hypothetical protein
MAKAKIKCLICERSIEDDDLLAGHPDYINGAVVGDNIEIYGHRTCVHNVDKYVVIPNRLRIDSKIRNFLDLPDLPKR